MAQAACRGVDRSLFFPERKAVSPKALALCSSCPVREECLDRAMAPRHARRLGRHLEAGAAEDAEAGGVAAARLARWGIFGDIPVI